MKQLFSALIFLSLAAGLAPAASVSLAEPPAGYVLDPGHLLGESKEADLRRLLSAHARQSAYDLYFVIVEPAPIVASAPTDTGATSIVPEPMKDPSPMLVRCLLTPS